MASTILHKILMISGDSVEPLEEGAGWLDDLVTGHNSQEDDTPIVCFIINEDVMATERRSELCACEPQEKNTSIKFLCV